MSGRRSAEHPRRLMLHGLRPAFSAFARRRWAITLHGAGRVPTAGPVIFAANHVGWIDGPLLAIVSPRPVHALTKKESFEGFMNYFLHGAGQIKLDRDCTDPHAINQCIAVLDAGGAVGVFPEGERGQGDFDAVRPGAAYLALRTGAPVVPVTFLGTREPGAGVNQIPGKGARFDVVYGEPVYLAQQPWPRTVRALDEASQTLHAHLRAACHSACELTGRELPGPAPDLADIEESTHD